MRGELTAELVVAWARRAVLLVTGAEDGWVPATTAKVVAALGELIGAAATCCTGEAAATAGAGWTGGAGATRAVGGAGGAEGGTIWVMAGTEATMGAKMGTPPRGAVLGGLLAAGVTLAAVPVIAAIISGETLTVAAEGAVAGVATGIAVGATTGVLVCATIGVEVGATIGVAV
jgi:hypothetical protein